MSSLRGFGGGELRCRGQADAGAVDARAGDQAVTAEPGEETEKPLRKRVPEAGQRLQAEESGGAPAKEEAAAGDRERQQALGVGRRLQLL